MDPLTPAPLPAQPERPEGEPASKTLVLGYGNLDRQDDGAAWHVLDRLTRRLDPGRVGLGDETSLTFPLADLMFALQLVPEMAETLAYYERVCFIDAHTGAQPEKLYWTALAPEFQASPFTHHMTPSTLLSITETLYARRSLAFLASIQGFEFGFDRGLSTRTASLVAAAEARIWAWLHEEHR